MTDPTQLLYALILGLVEGVTEFLPVSSTGHLLVAEHLLGTSKSDAFNVLIQVGPILAAALVFWKDIVALATGLSRSEVRDEAAKLAASFVLTGIGGLALKHWDVKLPETVLPIAVATLVGGIVIWAIEARSRRRQGETSGRITWGVAVAVAAAQLLAAGFPGTSRSGAAVMASLLLGLSRPAAVRFAFLVGIPTMLAAGGKQLFDAVRLGQAADLLAPDALVAFFVAIASAFLAVRWLLKFVQTRDFLPFAWYRLAMGAGLLLALGLGWRA
jgi:undecaprenyl-diphosphatase